jgi:integrase/recombinase XerD
VTGPAEQHPCLLPSASAREETDLAPRHTAATLAGRYSRDLRAVQDLLGPRDPRTASGYARVVDLATTNPVLMVPVKLS